MSLSRVSRFLMVLSLVTGGAALAQQRRQIQEFQGGETQQQRDADRSKPKYNINAYGKDVKIKEDPFPWKALGLAGLAFVVTAPFALRIYRGTTKEMADANVFGATGRGANDEE